MYAARLINPFYTLQFFPRCLRTARDFLFPSNKAHHLCTLIVAMIIALLIADFIAFAYAEKFHLANNFFYGKLQFSFVDGGYPESFGYLLELVTCGIFATFALQHKKKQWYAWSAILFVTFIDDAFRFHETAGHLYSVWFGGPEIKGEFIGFASTAIISATLWFLGVARIRNENDLIPYLVFTGYYALLMFFGIAVDTVHGIFSNASQTLFTLFEDGGELLTTAIICLSSFGMWLRERSNSYTLESSAAIQPDAESTSVTSKPF